MKGYALRSTDTVSKSVSGGRSYTVERVWEQWQTLCEKWGQDYRSFRRVTRMRGAMPNEESVLLLMGKTVMDKKSYLRLVPRIDLDRGLFPEVRL